MTRTITTKPELDKSLNSLPTWCSSLSSLQTTVESWDVARETKVQDLRPPQSLGLSSLGKYFPFFFSPCLGLHIYDVTPVGMVTILCKEALLSLELNKLTLHKKENLFWFDLFCLDPHVHSLELKLVSDSVISSLSKISGPIRKFCAFDAFSRKTGLSFWECWRERTIVSKLHKDNQQEPKLLCIFPLVPITSG